jgi:hypothetical protein
MGDSLPGCTVVDGQEVFYLQYPDATEFRSVFREIGRQCDPIPKYGAIVNEDATITLPDGTGMQGVSFRGDLSSWRRCVTEWCNSRGFRWGTIHNGQLTLSTGEVYALSECASEMR